jgi:hypothetical protein
VKKAFLITTAIGLTLLGANGAAWAFKILPPSAPMQAYPAPVELLRCPFKSPVQASDKKHLTSSHPSPLRPPQDVRRPPASR